MTVLMVITSYLLIGAILGWKDSVMVEVAIGKALEEIDERQVNLRRAATAVSITLIIIAAPVMELYYSIRKLKSKVGL